MFLTWKTRESFFFQRLRFFFFIGCCKTFFSSEVVEEKFMSKMTNTEENGERPVLTLAGNKTSITSPLKKMVSKSPQKIRKMDVSKERVVINSPQASSSAKVQTVLRRQEKILHSNLSLNASCSSDCSRDSTGSRASTGRIGSRTRLSNKKKQGLPRPEAILSKIGKIVPNGIVNSSSEVVRGTRRCSWVTPNTGTTLFTSILFL